MRFNARQLHEAKQKAASEVMHVARRRRRRTFVFGMLVGVIWGLVFAYYVPSTVARCGNWIGNQINKSE